MAEGIVRALCALALTAWAFDAAAATQEVWTFRDIVLDDGGSLSGHFTYTPDSSPHVTDWSVWATGGNAADFPIFEYRPDNSSLGEGSGGEIGFFATGSQRQVLFRPSLPLSGVPVYVPLYLDSPSSSAYESYGSPSPVRLIQAGALFTDPNPTRVRWFFDGATFSDGGMVTGYVDQSPGDTSIVKIAISVAGGNTATYPPMTYTGANSTTTIFTAAYANQSIHSIDEIGTIRTLRYTGQAPLHQDGGRVAIDLANAQECFNCAPFREFVTGTLRGVTDEVWGDGFE